MQISPIFEDCSSFWKVNQSKNTDLRVLLCAAFAWKELLKINQQLKKPSEICMMEKHFWEYLVFDKILIGCYESWSHHCVFFAVSSLQVACLRPLLLELI